MLRFGVLILGVSAVLASQERPAFAQLTAAQESELAQLDAVATAMGSLDSWIGNRPALAAEVLLTEEHFVAFANAKLVQHKDADKSTLFGQKLQDRVKQLQTGLTRWQSSKERFLKSAPKSIIGTITRLQRTVDKTTKASSVRTYASIVDSGMNQMQGQLKVLKACDGLSDDIKQQLAKLNTGMQTIEENYAAELRKARRIPRDSYRNDDRESLVAAVKEHWGKDFPKQTEVLQVLFLKGYWQRVYGATWNAGKKSLEVLDREYLPVLVVTGTGEGVATLTPYELQRTTKSDSIENGQATGERAWDVERSALK